MAQELSSLSSRTVANCGVGSVSESNPDLVVDQNATPAEQSPQSDSQNPTYRMSNWGMFKAFMVRILIMYMLSSFFRQQRTPANSRNETTSHQSLPPASNIFSSGDMLDIYFFLSESKNISIKKNMEAIWVKKGIKYGDWTSGPNKDGSYSFETDITASPTLINNGSLYLHVHFVKNGYSPYPDSLNDLYSKKFTISKFKKLTKQRRRSLKRTTNLLTGKSDVPQELKYNPEIHAEDLHFLPPTSHWHPNITVNLIEDYTPWTKGSVPSPLNEFIEFYDQTNQYYPIIYMNDYWNLYEDYIPINESTKQLHLSITFSPMSLFKWQMYAAQGMRKQWYSQFMSGVTTRDSDSIQNKEPSEMSLKDNIMATIQGGPEWLDEDGVSIPTQDEEREQDQIKKTMLETNPYLLALTFVVSLAHAVFEMLAFKNDIQFWNSRESLAGLSVQSVLFNVFQSLVIVLYVIDNDTNFVIKISVVIGAGIEFWKIFKVLKFRIIWPDKRRQLTASNDEPNSYVPLFLPRIEWAYERTYIESETQVYDKMAFKYLGCILFPLLGCYCIYSLVYQEHKGWYSWFLSMLYGFLLTFGFITMTPQLFINYKLKSVAHLPWRMLTYKALNTFIDDLFAFIIKAPTLYRLGCLRDDVIFFIYLYQRWIYPIDPARMNEFGVSKKMLDENKRASSPVQKGIPQLKEVDQGGESNDQQVHKRNLPTNN